MCSEKKGVLKDFVNFIGKYLCWSLFLIQLQAWHLFWRTSATEWFCNSSRTTHCYLSVLLYIQHLLLTSLLLLIISPIFAFGSNLKGFREFKSGILFSLKSLSLLLFSFSLFFLFSSVLFHYFLLLLTKRILLSWELIKMFLRPWRMTSLKYVHVNK